MGCKRKCFVWSTGLAFARNAGRKVGVEADRAGEPGAVGARDPAPEPGAVGARDPAPGAEEASVRDEGGEAEVAGRPGPPRFAGG
mmetsp:Transcript_129188/g.373992  ORF Transcript_129188/g.373992 Transcript_129188/m.373992 type:complete len:85 (+) Transcript_129188:447-701(+)